MRNSSVVSKGAFVWGVVSKVTSTKAVLSARRSKQTSKPGQTTSTQ